MQRRLHGRETADPAAEQLKGLSDSETDRNLHATKYNSRIRRYPLALVARYTPSTLSTVVGAAVPLQKPSESELEFRRCKRYGQSFEAVTMVKLMTYDDKV